MKKIVAFGTFDPLHEGHIDFLKQAKKLGYLIVIVSHSDKIKLEKSRVPRESDELRVNKVKELNLANEVCLSEANEEYNILEQIKPDIIALGYDQKIPEPLKNKVKKYKIISLKAFKPEIYKSSLIQ